MSNLTTCPDCGKEISKSAQTCPNCGRPIVQQKKEKKPVTCGGLFLALIFVTAVIAIIAGLGIFNEDINDTASSSTYSPPVTPTPPTPTVLGMDETYSTPVWNVSVTGTKKKNRVDSEYHYWTAGKGNYYLLVNVRLHNRTKQPQTFSSVLENPQIISEDGSIYNQKSDLSYQVKGCFEDGELNPNYYREGYFIFLLPDTVKKPRFRIDFFNYNSPEWKLYE